MRHIALWVIITIALSIFIPSTVYGSDIEAAGKIETVVLYRGQALVTRVIEIYPEKGAHQLVVPGLPVAVQSDSLFANANSGISIRAVRYRTRVVGESPVEEVRKLNEEIDSIQFEIRRNQNAQKQIQMQEQYLGSLRSFVVPTAKMEMSKGVLNTDSLTDLMSYIFKESKRLGEEGFRLEEEYRSLQGRLETSQRKLNQLAGGSSKEVREAVVFFEKNNDEKETTIRLGYLVDQATWSSVYNVRATNSSDKIVVEYSALVEQVSGEDWTDVALILSTASVGMSAEAPAMAPMLVTLTRGNNTGVQEDYATLMTRQRSEFSSRGRKGRKAQIVTDWNLNKFSNDLQGLEFNSSLDNVRSQQRRSTSGLTVNYDITGKVSVTSRTDRQMVEIRRLELPGEFANVVTPLLSEYVYREARLTNGNEIALLEGKANVYLDGQFVGAATVPMTAKGQKFRMGFGIDSQFRAGRELVSKSEVIQGGNKVMELKYRLVLENYKDAETKVRVLDRVPKTSQNLRVTVTSGTPLSEDPEYLRSSRPEGILRWDTTIPAKSASKTAHLIEYDVKFEFEKGMSISTGVSRQEELEMQEDFESNYD